MRYDFYGSRGKGRVLSDGMRAWWFLPLAFIADLHGFDLFAPYVGVVLLAVWVERWVKARRAAAVRG